jgi:DNA adenine methylase
MSNPEGWNKTLVKTLKSAAKFLENVIVKSIDYASLINYGQPNSVVYVDPPYYCNSLFPETSKLYRYNFTEEDHEKLALSLYKCKNKFVLSYDDCKEIRLLYKSHNIHSANWKYSGSSSCDGHNKKKKVGQELIITNF